MWQQDTHHILMAHLNCQTKCGRSSASKTGALKCYGWLPEEMSEKHRKNARKEHDLTGCNSVVLWLWMWFINVYNTAMWLYSLPPFWVSYKDSVTWSEAPFLVLLSPSIKQLTSSGQSKWTAMCLNVHAMPCPFLKCSLKRLVSHQRSPIASNGKTRSSSV